ncbi:MAG: hypothetical protein ACYS6K_05260 [Planctomycetota bacterium]
MTTSEFMLSSRMLRPSPSSFVKANKEQATKEPSICLNRDRATVGSGHAIFENYHSLLLACTCISL